jgi:hypothetical protein
MHAESTLSESEPRITKVTLNLETTIPQFVPINPTTATIDLSHFFDVRPLKFDAKSFQSQVRILGEFAVITVVALEHEFPAEKSYVHFYVPGIAGRLISWNTREHVRGRRRSSIRT